jgi:hypothetical protein
VKCGMERDDTGTSRFCVTYFYMYTVTVATVGLHGAKSSESVSVLEIDHKINKETNKLTNSMEHSPC